MCRFLVLVIEELCALVEGKEWDKAWFLTIGLTMDIPELEVNIRRVGLGGGGGD